MSRFWFAGGGLDQYTKVLLHFDNTLTDLAKPSRTWTGVGAGYTASSKFGAAALNCGAAAGYVTTPDDADFTVGSGDFTVDFWFNVQGGVSTASRMLFGQVDSGNFASNVSYNGQLSSTDHLTFAANQGSTAITITAGGTITTSGWHHYAGVRTGGTLALFLDGVLQGTAAISGAINDSAYSLSIGRNGDAAGVMWNGFIDEFRLSVGIARWTSNFTPPTGPYS